MNIENFTKKDLKTGMIVVTRDGREWLVLKNCYNGASCADKTVDLLCAFDGTGYLNMDNYNEEMLRANSAECLDIMTVKGPEHISDIIKSPSNIPVIWKRQEPRDMTLEEVEKVLGYKVHLTDKKFRVLEKTVPNYNIFSGDPGQFTCPNCGFYVKKYHKRKKDGDLCDLKNNNCWNCGQALDFSDIEEEILKEKGQL